MVSNAYNQGLKVHPYTFRADQLGEFSSFDEQLQTILFDAGTYGCFTDFHDKMVEFLKKN